MIYNAYLAAKFGVKINGIDNEDMRLAQEFVEHSKKFPGKLVELPVIIESDTIDGKIEGKFRKKDIRNFKKGDKLNFILDVAPESFIDPVINRIFHEANTVFVNAVMGFTPHFNEGTIALDQLIDDNSNAVKLYGGGDTMQELKRLLPGLYIAALDSPRYYIFTGGGAVLKAIEKGDVTGIEPVKILIEGTK